MVDFAKYDSQTNWRTKLPFPRIEDDVTKAMYLQDIMGSDPAAETKRIVATKKKFRLAQTDGNAKDQSVTVDAILWPLYSNTILPWLSFAVSSFIIMPAIAPDITRGGAILAGYTAAATTNYQIAYVQQKYPGKTPNTDPSVGKLTLPKK